MITKLSIANTAIFGEKPVVLDALLQFNYVYGANGTGKTTISRFLNTCDDPDFSHCSMSFLGVARPRIMVYNRDFVEDKMNVSTSIPGIFTFADENETARDKIKELADTSKDNMKILEGLNVTLKGADGKSGELGKLRKLTDDFKSRCWRQKKKYDTDFKFAFTGYRRNSEDFKEKILKEYSENRADLLELEVLKDKASSIFTDVQTPEPPLETSYFKNLIDFESSPILQKVVVGKQDIDIATMITKLGNSDWVKSGRVFYENNDMYCPFCQQPTTESFSKDLEEYFDKSYETDLQAIKGLGEVYANEVQTVKDRLNSITVRSSDFVDVNQLKAERDALIALLQTNATVIEEKLKEPSRVFKLKPIAEVVSRIEKLLKTASEKIEKHNKLVANISAERKLLTAQVWRFIIDIELGAEIEKYLGEKSKVDKAINGITDRITITKNALDEAKKQSDALGRQMTSIEPTVKRINRILQSFGFLSFHLKVAEDKHSYEIVRSNGKDARKTLSEGERAFISFLYFYHLISGSESESGISGDRIVVFDDPVSSLDCDVLFIVSSLIKQTVKESREHTSRVKQVFVFTHNVFFHREVTFDIDRRGKKRNDESFLVLRKVNNIPSAKSHDENPVSTSYDLLWSELREEDLNSSTLANVMRRIVEHYFKLLGGMKDEDIFRKFEGDEQSICRSLFSWMNYGSHNTDDDLYVAVDEAMIDKYKLVFKKVFKETGHEKHFEMMMRGHELSVTQQDSSKKLVEEAKSAG